LEAGERAVSELVRLNADLDDVPDQLRVVAARRPLELGVRSVPKRHRQLLPFAVPNSTAILPQRRPGAQKPISRRPLIMWISVSNVTQARCHCMSSSVGRRHFVSTTTQVPSARPTSGPATARAELTRCIWSRAGPTS